MVRLSSPRREIFTREDFEAFPVWTWDDEHVAYLPISEKEPFSEDYDILIIKSKFETNDYVFDGFLTGGFKFHAFGIFVGEKLFPMNLRLHDFAEETLKKIFQELKCEPFEFFPVKYYSSVRLKENRNISGFIEMSKHREGA